jgi:GrpB-like predicted nucleotidyltransferase (UPF0157 family)
MQMNMRYDFSGITPEMRIKLFPIILEEHSPQWFDNYLIEKSFIEGVLGKDNIVRISHYGSTSIPGLIAKPTIDILLEISTTVNLAQFIEDMQDKGYVYVEQPNDPPPHVVFYRGYTPEGFKGQAVHIHVRYPGDWDELYFRDYLLTHPKTAAEYGELKQKQKNDYEFDRDGYTAAKGEFIRRITEETRRLFAGRYMIKY